MSESRRNARRKWREKNAEKWKEIKQNYYKRKRQIFIKKSKEYKSSKPKTCITLKKHAEDLKDDPERLSTKFLQKLIGIKCK